MLPISTSNDIYSSINNYSTIFLSNSLSHSLSVRNFGILFCSVLWVTAEKSSTLCKLVLWTWCMNNFIFENCQHKNDAWTVSFFNHSSCLWYYTICTAAVYIFHNTFPPRMLVFKCKKDDSLSNWNQFVQMLCSKEPVLKKWFTESKKESYQKVFSKVFSEHFTFHSCSKIAVYHCVSD